MLPVYAAGEEEGQLYLAMRYVEGEDLKTLLAREGKLDAGASPPSAVRSPRPWTPLTAAASSTAT